MSSLATIVATSFLALTAPAPASPLLLQETGKAPDTGKEDEDVELTEREARFAQLLNNVKLVGSFTLGEASGELREDSYTVTSARKLDDGRWLIEAQVEYQGIPIPFALPVPVEWAGDLPVISITEMVMPGLGTYSAHVLFQGDQYAGVWSGKDHGGHMFGRIEPIEPIEEEGDAGEAGGAVDDDAGGDGGPGGDGARSSAIEGGAGDDAAGVHWPSFRGPQASGVSEGFTTPVEWDVEKGENVVFREPVPGLAHSSPVIWGDTLFLTSAVRLEGEQELRVGLYGDIAPVQDESPFGFEVYAYDKTNGELLWARTAWEGVPAIKRHTKGSHAASTPATDGERVVAFFGTEGLYCYDMEGEPLWEREFGVLDSGYYMVPDAQWGFASSPVLHGDLVLVQCDVQGESFVAALRAEDGEEVWRTARDEVPTWSTPTVDVRDGRSQVICNGYKHIGGYDLATGKELWKLEGGGDIPVPTPIVSHDLIFITNAHGQMAPIYAISTAAEGELSMDPEACEHMAWSSRRGIYMQTPLVYGEELYCCADSGVMACYDAATGEPIYRERLGTGMTGFTSSGIAADGKLYFASEMGDVHVVQAGQDFEVLAVNSLGEECMASPAISEGVLFYRTRGHLLAVGEVGQDG